jgi:heme A synthase
MWFDGEDTVSLVARAFVVAVVVTSALSYWLTSRFEKKIGRWANVFLLLPFFVIAAGLYTYFRG